MTITTRDEQTAEIEGVEYSIKVDGARWTATWRPGPGGWSLIAQKSGRKGVEITTRPEEPTLARSVESVWDWINSNATP